MAVMRLPTSAGDASAADALRDPTASALRARAAADPKAAIKAAAQQFEALFMQQLMKSMREASTSSGMLDNAGTQMGTEMLDTQYANQMTGLRGGLSDVIARQLERQMNGLVPGQVLPTASAAGTAGAAGAATAPSAAAGAGVSGRGASVRPVKLSQEEFLRVHQQSARAAEEQTGIPATFMVAQAAHESGWGKHEIRNNDGSASFNLFGIKAGASWKGKTAQVTTTEFVNGQPQKVVANFRSYASYEESFRDYAGLMKNNPRYANVVTAGNNAEGFAKGLQRAGYATDPAYAEKLTRVINTSLRLQRATAQTHENTA